MINAALILLQEIEKLMKLLGDYLFIINYDEFSPLFAACADMDILFENVYSSFSPFMFGWSNSSYIAVVYYFTIITIIYNEQFKIISKIREYHWCNKMLEENNQILKQLWTCKKVRKK